MSHGLHLILRCDTRTDGTRCPGYFIGSGSRDIEQVREAAGTQGWTFRPGSPHRHIGATDTCKGHSP